MSLRQYWNHTSYTIDIEQYTCYVCNSCTMGTSSLSDINYTEGLRATGPRAEGVYIM